MLLFIFKKLTQKPFVFWSVLFFQGFPVIFHGVVGKDERESNSPSFFNTSEIDIMMDYLKKLLLTQAKKGIAKISPKEIGIIAPYRKQVKIPFHQLSISQPDAYCTHNAVNK